MAKHQDTPAPRLPGSLRDWFAGIALTGSELTLHDDEGRFFFTPTEIAQRAYRIADAMLRERAK